MKIFFLKNDSLYKIFKSLEKIPNGREVFIDIENGHEIYNNERRGKQIKEIVDKKKINATFNAFDDKTKKFFENVGLNYYYSEKNKILKILNGVMLFFFNIKKFHLYIYNKKNIVFYLIFFIDLLFIFFVLFLLYSFILPSSTIKIKPSKNIEQIVYNFRYYNAGGTGNMGDLNISRFISIPYYTGFLDYKYNMSVSISHLKHIQNPSHGKIKIYNKTDKEYSIVPNTRFITNDGLLFSNSDRFKIPKGNNDSPGEVTITVSAMEKDEKGYFIGNKGNISKGTYLSIKNLKSSFYLKKIYAYSIENFTGGRLEYTGTITADDIKILSGRLVDYIKNNKISIIVKNFKTNDMILFGNDKLVSYKIKEIKSKNRIGEKITMLNGYAIAHYEFKYIKQEELENAIEKYLLQRQTEKTKLLKIDFNSLSFFYKNMKILDDGVIIIPTKINIIQGYNFENDINGIVEELKNSILNKNLDEAKNIILNYGEVAGVSIKITPFWYSQIPQIKSRIKIIFQ